MAKNGTQPEPIEDDYVSPYIKFDFPPEKFKGRKLVDLGNIRVKDGTDYEGDPCHSIEGELLVALDGHEVGETVIIGGSQKKLRRLIENGIKQGKIVDGIRLTIEHIGYIGRMPDFTVTPYPTVSARTASDDQPAPF